MVVKSKYFAVPCTTCKQGPGKACVNSDGARAYAPCSQRVRLHQKRVERGIPLDEPASYAAKAARHGCRDISCPHCFASKGSSCVTSEGKLVKGRYHKARKDRYARGQAQRTGTSTR